MAERIKQRMQEIGMTQDQLATAASLTQPAIFKLLSGKTKRTTRLAEIARALGVRPEWLVTGTGKKEPTGDADDQAFLAAYHPLPETEQEAVRTLVFRGRPLTSDQGQGQNSIAANERRVA